jgi:hypothetical protein
MIEQHCQFVLRAWQCVELVRLAHTVVHMYALYSWQGRKETLRGFGERGDMHVKVGQPSFGLAPNGTVTPLAFR